MPQENKLKKRFLVLVNANEDPAVPEAGILKEDNSIPSGVQDHPQVLQFQPPVTRSLPGESSSPPALATSQKRRSTHAQPVNLMAHTPPPLPPTNPNFPSEKGFQTTSEPEDTVDISDASADYAPSEANAPVPYDVHTEGPLTYFNYYFEDVDLSAANGETMQSASRSKVSLGLVGVGVVAATVASGLFIRDAFKTAEPPPDTQPVDASTKQQTTTNLLRPSTASPEQLTTPRSQPSPSIKPKPPAAPRPTAPPSKQSLLLETEPLPLPVAPAIAVPETLASNQTAPVVQLPKLPPINQPLPTVAVRETPDPINREDSVPNAQQTTTRPPGMVAIARPESLPMIKPEAGNPLQSANSVSTVSTAFPPAASTATDPTTAPPEVRAVEFNPSSSLTNVPATQEQDSPDASMTSNAPVTQTEQGSNPLQQLFPAPQAPLTSQADATNLRRITPQAVEASQESDRTSIQTNLSKTTTSQGLTISVTRPTNSDNQVAKSEIQPIPVQEAAQPRIQDYLTLPQQLPTDKAVALLPLTQAAAEEAVKTERVGQFIVRQVNPQDYQKEWVSSNSAVADPAIALGFPAYGFIDYERRVIVVLQETKTASEEETPIASVPFQTSNAPRIPQTPTLSSLQMLPKPIR